MPLVTTNESKNDLSLTNEDKDSSLTWDGSDPLTWDDEDSQWNAPGVPFNKESKNDLSLTNESKV